MRKLSEAAVRAVTSATAVPVASLTPSHCGTGSSVFEEPARKHGAHTIARMPVRRASQLACLPLPTSVSSLPQWRRCVPQHLWRRDSRRRPPAPQTARLSSFPQTKNNKPTRLGAVLHNHRLAALSPWQRRKGVSWLLRNGVDVTELKTVRQVEAAQKMMLSYVNKSTPRTANEHRRELDAATEEASPSVVVVQVSFLRSPVPSVLPERPSPPHPPSAFRSPTCRRSSRRSAWSTSRRSRPRLR